MACAQKRAKFGLDPNRSARTVSGGLIGSQCVTKPEIGEATGLDSCQKVAVSAAINGMLRRSGKPPTPVKAAALARDCVATCSKTITPQQTLG